MDTLDEEILNLWKAFHNRSLRYIMVGGFFTILNDYRD